MAWSKFKWKRVLFLYLIMFNVFTKSLPINTHLSSLTNTDKYEISVTSEVVDTAVEEYSDNNVEAKNYTGVDTKVNVTTIVTDKIDLRQLKPDQEVTQYDIELTINGDSFNGRVLLEVRLAQTAREDRILLHSEGLTINSVKVGIFSEANVVDTWFTLSDGILEIEPATQALLYIVIIEYSGQLADTRHGLNLGKYQENTYLAMNLHPMYARHVFPCIDEPNAVAMMSFTFNVEYPNLVTNSMLVANSENAFESLQGPPHLWGMIAHNFATIVFPATNVRLLGRQTASSQENMASLTINSVLDNLNTWTNRPYFEIVDRQDGRMNIFALPDVSSDWNSISTIGIWEPYILMENTQHSVKQLSIALPTIAEAMARQWFGYLIFPEDWRFNWIPSGLASYAAYEMLKLFQTNPEQHLDIDTIFVSNVIQESLLMDGYNIQQKIEPDDDLILEDLVRNYINGIVRYKAPAILSMLRLVLGGPDQDFVRSAGRAMLARSGLVAVNKDTLLDALNGDWLTNGNGRVNDIGEFLEPWLKNSGYPVVHVLSQAGSLFLTQERLGLTTNTDLPFQIPITFTTSNQKQFENADITMMNDVSFRINVNVNAEEEEWVVCNIKGQGYYRVNYALDLWENLIIALDDPDTRAEIDPLNRATLVDDALNLARWGKLDYDIAFRVVLTMVHETEYPVWKAFVRNMEFLRKRLVNMVEMDEDLDPDIYLRMVRRTIETLEDELGFDPDGTSEPPMTTLTRGLVMEHACKANYEPCIAAAIDLFYDPNNNDPVVNPRIPHELRPAVYCTMVREDETGGAIEALEARFEIEPSHYERVVILESFACSRDENFIRTLLVKTLEANTYLTEERVKIFKAVVESNAQNALIAVQFLANQVGNIRNMYGGPEKLEELLFVVSENIVNDDLFRSFRDVIQLNNNNLEDSQEAGNRAFSIVDQNNDWSNDNLQYVYDWIDENDAPTLVLSIMALSVSLFVALFVH